MRIIGIGLLAFLLTGAAYMLSHMNVWQRGLHHVNEMVSGPQLVFETSIPTSLDLAPLQAVIYRNNPSIPIILSGLPAYQGAAFSMPIDARPTSGYLQVDATFQVLNGVEGVLRISINNIRRGEMLLRRGETGRSLQIFLTSEELASEKLVVSFSLLGEGPNSGCVSEAGVETIAEIEATSALYLTLDRPLESIRDRMVSWGNVIHVGWPDILASDDRRRRLILAAEFTSAGKDVVFLYDAQADALDIDELRSLAASLRSSPLSPSANWPLAIAETGANAGARRFHLTTSWRKRYELSDFSDMQMPTAMELSLILGQQHDAATWTVTTTLNGRIVQMDTVEYGQTEFKTNVLLPEDNHQFVNVIDVTATTSFNPEGTCNSGPELIAEMRSDTMLIGGGMLYDSGLNTLREQIATHPTVGVLGDVSLSAPEALLAAQLMAGVLTDATEAGPIEREANITPLGRAGTAALSRVTPRLKPTWIVYHDTETQHVMAEVMSPEVVERVSRSAPTTLLIEFPLDFAEAAAQ